MELRSTGRTRATALWMRIQLSARVEQAAQPVVHHRVEHQMDSRRAAAIVGAVRLGEAEIPAAPRFHRNGRARDPELDLRAGLHRDMKAGEAVLGREVWVAMLADD